LYLGFTLIELLVALAIFAVISVMSLRAVSSAVESRTHIEEEGRKWRELGRVFAALEADLANVLHGVPFAGSSLPDADGVWLAFARAGRGDEDETLVPPRRIAYSLAAGHIERTISHALHAPDAAAATGNRYPPLVRALALRYLSERGEWRAQWSHADGAAPRAIEIAIELGSGERLRRIMLVR
jgi:general secretion pathway protein J